MNRRRRGAMWLLAGVACLFVPLVAPAANAQEAQFIGFTFLADADTIGFQGGQQASAGYPQAVSQTAHTESSVNTGPNASALASAQWPGQFLGNLGSLIQAFGGPPESANANYPVRAQASSSGPTTAESPGVSAQAEGATALSDARVDGFDDAGDFFSFGDARATSRSALEGPLGVSVATSVVSDIDFGGVITIDSVMTKASVSTDGVKGTATGETLVSGLEVAGQPATVDENGVRFASTQNPSPADALKQQAIDAALANFSQGFTVQMFTAEPVVRQEGGLQEYRSGSLVILMTFGDPQGDGGDGAFVIGGSNAFVQASPGIPASPAPLPTAPPATTPTTPTPTPAAPIDTPAPPVDLGPTPIDTTPAAETPTEVAAPTAPVTAAPTFASPLAEIARFDGLPFIMPFFILLASLFIGRALHLFHESLVGGPAGTTCIDDGDPS